MMDSTAAIGALAALAQNTRLEAFRLLVSRAPGGVAAGELARMLAVPQNTMSAHLAVLARGGLVQSERKGRSIIYRANLEGLRDVVVFLAKDCCGGRPELCGPLVADILSLFDQQEAQLMIDRPYNVLFLCTGNSARSIMAEALLNKLGAGRFDTFSAGSHPKGVINPFTLKVLGAYSFPTEGYRSKSWDEFAASGAPQLDFVFTVCDSAAGEACPVWPGQPMTAHWGIEDPASVQGPDIEKEKAFVTAFKYLRNRISIFVSLPIRSLDKMALERKLHEIGHMDGATSVAKKS
jgi:protein-tyrosine-phosphatase/DNA-binding transcriptional ArsR family regulator